jgi:hypothetical protein
MLLTGSSIDLLHHIQAQLCHKYEMKNLGDIQRYLRVQFSCFRGGILMHQRDYSAKILADANMSNCSPAVTPLPVGTALSAKTGTQDYDQLAYCHTVGQLLYLANTRPDLSYAVGYVSRFMSHPELAHWQAVLHILRYLKGTLDYGILYRKADSPKVHGFSSTAPALKCKGFIDADWAACKDSRRSTGGYLFSIAQGAVTWASKRQPTVSMSTTEAEYRSLSDGAKEAVYLKRLLQELTLQLPKQVPVNCSDTQVCSEIHKAQTPTEIDVHLHCDNISAIQLARNPVFHAPSKHIEIHHHFIGERIIQGEVTVSYIKTEDQPADILTKALPQDSFEKHRLAIGIRSLQELKVTSLY